MAITTSFTTSQVLGAPQNIVITDTSTGSDVTAATRRVYLQTAAGQYITEAGTFDTPTYTTWALSAGNSLTLDVLDTDMALDVNLQYVTSGGSIVSEDTVLSGFTLYNETFYYSLTQSQASQSQPPPMILQDTTYFTNKLILRTLIDSGNQAINYGSDIVSAQNCYDDATYMVTNQNDYF